MQDYDRLVGGLVFLCSGGILVKCFLFPFSNGCCNCLHEQVCVYNFYIYIYISLINAIFYILALKF